MSSRSLNLTQTDPEAPWHRQLGPLRSVLWLGPWARLARSRTDECIGDGKATEQTADGGSARTEPHHGSAFWHRQRFLERLVTCPSIISRRGTDPSWRATDLAAPSDGRGPGSPLWQTGRWRRKPLSARGTMPAASHRSPADGFSEGVSGCSWRFDGRMRRRDVTECRTGGLSLCGSDVTVHRRGAAPAGRPGGDHEAPLLVS